LFAGTWRKNKGIQDLVPAFCTLAGRHPDLHLMVLGAGVPRAVVEQAFPPVFRPRVEMASTTTDEETARAFASCDVFVLPSLFEGTPLTLMEAMMSGLPIVTTATCGMKDVVRDGVTGLLVPLRSPQRLVDAIERLRADAALRERLGRQAQAEALACYTWDRVAQIVQSAYNALLDRRRRVVHP
jgi:glycosyltransferase involved in cell wall biosynthesis